MLKIGGVAHMGSTILDELVQVNRMPVLFIGSGITNYTGNISDKST